MITMMTINAAKRTEWLLVPVGGMFAESQEGDDEVSISSGIDNEEDSAPSAPGKGGALTTTMRRKGMSTPPATPGTTRGECTCVVWQSYHVTATTLTAGMLCSVRYDSVAAAFKALLLFALHLQS